MTETIDLQRMKALGGYWYVATPYTKYHAGLEAAFEEACRAAAWLIKQGVAVFCPIAHTHPIAVQGQMDLTDLALWLDADRPLMAGARGIVVVRMDGWDKSSGVRHEIEFFDEESRPVFFMDWPRR